MAGVMSSSGSSCSWPPAPGLCCGAAASVAFSFPLPEAGPDFPLSSSTSGRPRRRRLRRPADFFVLLASCSGGSCEGLVAAPLGPLRALGAAAIRARCLDNNSQQQAAPPRRRVRVAVSVPTEELLSKCTRAVAAGWLGPSSRTPLPLALEVDCRGPAAAEGRSAAVQLKVCTSASTAPPSTSNGAVSGSTARASTVRHASRIADRTLDQRSFACGWLPASVTRRKLDVSV
mmetsp:Transcript_28446/g.83137  ORF Transcript_28446/g.83137 Transcript_28446/m.83137 type:complete len:231 (-) Transcript_28446:307-999(-)